MIYSEFENNREYGFINVSKAMILRIASNKEIKHKLEALARESGLLPPYTITDKLYSISVTGKIAPCFIDDEK